MLAFRLPHEFRAGCCLNSWWLIFDPRQKPHAFQGIDRMIRHFDGSIGGRFIAVAFECEICYEGWNAKFHGVPLGGQRPEAIIGRSRFGSSCIPNFSSICFISDTGIIS